MTAAKAFIASRLLSQRCGRAWNAESSGCSRRVLAESQRSARKTAESDGDTGSVPQKYDAGDADRVLCLLQAGPSSASHVTACESCLAMQLCVWCVVQPSTIVRLVQKSTAAESV